MADNENSKVTGNQEQREKMKKKYWDGNLNKCFRYWFYLNRGTDIINQFRYIFAIIFGIYFALKLKNGLWLLGMIGISIPILLVLGYYSVHHVSKVLDWLSTEFSTHWSRYQYDLLENQLKELKDINAKLKDK